MLFPGGKGAISKFLNEFHPSSLKQNGPHEHAGLFASSGRARQDESGHWVEVVPVI